jgi:hypothetical protein
VRNHANNAPQELFAEGSLHAQGGLWHALVDEAALKLVDADSSVPDDLLHLLTSAAKQISPARLASYLHTMITATAGTRADLTSRRKRAKDISRQFAGPEGVPGALRSRCCGVGGCWLRCFGSAVLDAT